MQSQFGLCPSDGSKQGQIHGQRAVDSSMFMRESHTNVLGGSSINSG